MWVIFALLDPDPSDQKKEVDPCGSGSEILEFIKGIPAVWRIRDVYPGSRIPIFTHPGSRIWIPDPKKATKERGEKKIVVKTFYVATNFTKLQNYFSFEVLKKKIWDNFQRIIELFTQKIVNKLTKIWGWDPESEIRDPEKTYSGSRIQGSKRHRSRIRIRNTVYRVDICLYNDERRTGDPCRGKDSEDS